MAECGTEPCGTEGEIFLGPDYSEMKSLPCPNCSEDLKNPHILQVCMHLLCETCAKSNIQYSKVQCPVLSCRKVSPDNAMPQVGKGVAKCCPIPGDKAMEEDLLKDPFFELSGQFYVGPPEGAPEAKEALDDKPKFQYAKSKLTDDWQRKIDLPSKVNERDILQTLCQVVTKEQGFILGWYACNIRNKIVVDVTDGDEYIEKTNKFLETHFQSITTELFEIVPQEYQPEQIVGAASKIIDHDKNGVRHIFQNNDNAHPDQLTKGYGTITCLAEKDSSEDGPRSLYALTSKHVFSQDVNQPSRVETKVIAALNGCLKVVGEEYIGHKGPIRLTETRQINQDSLNPPNDIDNKAVDIAAVPLLREIENQLDRNLLHDLKPYFKDSDDIIKGMLVSKQGAATGDTTGTIYQTDYFSHRNGLVSGGYIMIHPNHPHKAFADTGDSGSLVCGFGSPTPVGILVQKWIHTFMNKDGKKITHTAAIAVRLDNCLKALEKVGVKIKACKLYCAQPPIDSPGQYLNTETDGSQPYDVD